MNKSIIVKTPRGQVVTSTTRSGRTTAKLEWAEDFGEKRTEAFNKAQMYVDSEVLRLSSPYMPIRTGALIRSGQLGTVIGEGEVNWITPYAATQYYDTARGRVYDARRGSKWFERMKVDHRTQIIAGAKRIGGGNG